MTKSKFYIRLLPIILLIIVTIIIYYKSNYQNNYFYNNEKDILEVVNYINDNDLMGAVDKKENSNNYYNTGSLYIKCIEENKCYINNLSIPELMKKLNINSIEAYREYIGILPNSNLDTSKEGISLFFDDNFELYGNSDNYIYYSKGFYVDKTSKGGEFNGNKFHRIIQIYNNDFGVINGCYNCGGGAWD